MRENEIKKKIKELQEMLLDYNNSQQMKDDISKFILFHPGKMIAVSDAFRILGIEYKKGGRSQYVAKVLRACGWSSTQCRVGKKIVRGWIKKQ